MNLIIRPAVEEDLTALVQIEQESFSHPHWTTEDFVYDKCLIAEIDGEIAGLLVSRETYSGDAESPPEREILNLAVARRFRRIGVATALLNHELRRRGSYFLEVRESNVAARELYRKFGFIEAGHRPNYYQYPVERAIVMQMK